MATRARRSNIASLRHHDDLRVGTPDERHALDVVLRQSPDGIVITDATGRPVRWNPTAERMLEAVSRGPRKDRSIALPRAFPLRRALEEGVALEAHEIRIQRRDGSHESLIATVVPIRGDRDEITGSLTVLKAASTDPIRAEHVAGGVEPVGASDPIPSLVAFIGADRRYRWVNSGYETWFGVPRTEIVGRGVRDLVGTEAFSRIRARLDEAFAGNEVSYEEHMPYRHHGWRWVATTLTPHQSADGSIDSVIALTRDIGERKIAERERQELLERERAMREEVEILYRLTDAMNRVRDLDGVFAPALDAVLAALHVDRASILLFDPDRVMRFKAWRGLSDRYRAAVEGHSPWTPESIDPEPEFSPDVEADPALEHYQGVFRDEGVRALGFFPLISAHRVIGKFMVYDSKPRTLSDREIRIAKTIATHVAQGVARQCAFEEAEQQRQRAETAGRAKDEFLAMVSHELRTPLTAVVGWTHMLVTGAVSEAKRAKALETIDRNAHLQMQLVEDLLDFSRITTGKVRLHLSRLDFAEVVVHVLESFRPAAEAKGIALEFAVEGSVGMIEGDADRIQQIVWNLVSNAVKFTPRGGTVRVELRRDDSEVTVAVKDDGEGIDAAFMPFVFERFRQGDAGAARTRGGLGLGLAIVRHLAELHGGSVTVASPGRGRGATFRVSLPAPLRA